MTTPRPTIRPRLAVAGTCLDRQPRRHFGLSVACGGHIDRLQQTESATLRRGFGPPQFSRSQELWRGAAPTRAARHVASIVEDGGVAIWPLVLGPARAKQYLLTGDSVSAAEAERLGLVNTVSAPERLQEEAFAFAERLAAGAPLAVRYTEMAVNKLMKDALNVAFDTSTALEIVTFQSDDHKEALAAIREKRAPIFRGR